MSFLLNFNYTKERVFSIEKQKSSGFIQICSFISYGEKIFGEISLLME